MSKHYTVFYSWQSDKKKSSNSISSSIEKAIKKVKRSLSEEISLEINFDRDTRNTSGSPQIAQTIFDKISQCDIFICDVSLINNSYINPSLNRRVASNPNVLIELGYAIHCLGWERIICVNNTEFGTNEMLPFDIRAHRITSFNRKEEKSKNSLVKILQIGITSIFEDYEGILERHASDEFKKKDRIVFSKIEEIISESQLTESLNTVVTNLYYNNHMHSKWVKLVNYYKESINHFLNQNLNNKTRELVHELDLFPSLCYRDINVPNNICSGPSLFELESNGVTITEELRIDTLQNERYFIMKEPYPSETWTECHRRMDEVASNLNSQKEIILKHYSDLIILYRKEVL
ncbi:hypothetical protein JM84_3056 [Dokdonia sp. Hel_I_63]|uniref:hypothetical protein n=1 Tax=Dokdonia sp. Hel_I_63 TaxID=1249996 RepID=UPI0011991BFB|nr:hypothetical protein [Dokdonia sp. Hel_I_63]TVZ24097.1 hypothetical protein JM84_3056 [Dokdonia sp. Hel_I_63]